jgi:hypothetical protein
MDGHRRAWSTHPITPKSPNCLWRLVAGAFAVTLAAIAADRAGCLALGLIEQRW